MIRVLHSISTIHSGGVERQHAQVIRATQGQGWEHDVIASHATGPVLQELTDLGCHVQIAGTAIIRRTWTTRGTIRRLRPDLVHGAVIDGYSPAAFAGWTSGVPVLVEETSDPTNRSWKGHALARAATAAATHCIAVSPAVGRHLADDLRVPPERLTVIPNGVEQPRTLDERATAALRRELGIPVGHRVVGSVGRMHDDDKRFGDLLQAFALLRGDDGHSEVTLLLVGDGRRRAALERHAQALGVADRVVFAGFQHDVGPYYGLMDAFALASGREAFGLVLAEAMRCALPVVATRVGGIPDVVEDGVTGVLVAPGAPGKLARALRIALDRDVGAAFGRAGKQRADRLFSSERYVADVVALYERVLGARRHPGAHR